MTRLTILPEPPIHVDGGEERSPSIPLRAAVVAGGTVRAQRVHESLVMRIVPRITDDWYRGPLQQTRDAWYDVYWAFQGTCAHPVRTDLGAEAECSWYGAGGGAVMREYDDEMRWRESGQPHGTPPPVHCAWYNLALITSIGHPPLIPLAERLAAAPAAPEPNAATIRFLGGPEAARHWSETRRENLVAQDRSAGIYDWTAYAQTVAELYERESGTAPVLTPLQRLAAKGALRLRLLEELEFSATSLAALAHNARRTGGGDLTACAAYAGVPEATMDEWMPPLPGTAPAVP